ncbi:hypothetical protein [Nonomuraea sp. NPDC049141]|uniref:hypothetical protein n=1 Tax=Nonomuraea sp. NPDC049141 TaxID=3155500 RepID=UPI00340BF404
MSERYPHNVHAFLDNPREFPLDFHATITGDSPQDIRSKALLAAHDFYGQAMEETGVYVVSADVVKDDSNIDPLADAYKATVVFRQVTE